MHPYLKRIGRLLPPVRRIVAQRDSAHGRIAELTAEVERLKREVKLGRQQERNLWKKHRPYTSLRVEPAISCGTKFDTELAQKPRHLG